MFTLETRGNLQSEVIEKIPISQQEKTNLPNPKTCQSAIRSRRTSPSCLRSSKNCKPEQPQSPASQTIYHLISLSSSRSPVLKREQPEIKVGLFLDRYPPLKKYQEPPRKSYPKIPPNHRKAKSLSLPRSKRR